MLKEFAKFIKSFSYAFRGIFLAFARERNLRFHLCMAIYVVFFSIIGEVGTSDVLKFVICFGAVMSAELINTALEKVCDMISTEKDERIRNVKDIAAGAVLITAATSATVGLLVFLRADIFLRVMNKFAAEPVVLAMFLLSVPLALCFILKRGKR